MVNTSKERNIFHYGIVVTLLNKSNCLLFIHYRLTYEQRMRLRALEAALKVS